jgi:hypothetical protein
LEAFARTSDGDRDHGQGAQPLALSSLCEQRCRRQLEPSGAKPGRVRCAKSVRLHPTIDHRLNAGSHGHAAYRTSRTGLWLAQTGSTPKVAASRWDKAICTGDGSALVVLILHELGRRSRRLYYAALQSGCLSLTAIGIEVDNAAAAGLMKVRSESVAIRPMLTPPCLYFSVLPAM